MKKFKQEFIVYSNIEKVWKFYTDINHLKIITPPNLNLKIIKTSSQLITEGQEIIIEGKIGIFKRKWNSKITYLKPYQYIDEMINGPFKRWKHNHIFQKINENETQITDEIEFGISFGIIGRLLEMIAFSNLIKIFEYRKKTTKEKLERN